MGVKGEIPMRRSRCLLLSLIPMLLCVAGLALADEPYRETFDQTYPIAAGGRASLSNVNGDVQVNVWDQNTVRVQAVKEAESREDLDALRIEVSAAASSVRVETHYPRNTHSHLSVEYTLTVPKGVSLDDIDLVNGGLTVSGLGGGVHAKLVNGAAKLTGLAGEVVVHTVNGEQEVELDRLSSGQRVELHTVNGSIELRLAPSVSADVEAKTVNGHLSNDFGLPVHKHEYVGADMGGAIGSGGGRVELKSVNGAIRVTKT
jgi:DUF4097 and DUF4098 domain-containing protein YvlB